MAAPKDVWSQIVGQKRSSVIHFCFVGLVGLAIAVPVQTDAAEITADQQRAIDQLLQTLNQTKGNMQEFGRPPINSNMKNDTNEIVQTRRLLIDVSREAERLIDALREELYNGLPGMNQIFGQTLTLKSDLKVLTDRANRVHDHKDLLEGARELDRDWRSLAYRLSQMRGLSQNAQRSVQRITEYARVISESMNVQPQLDRREVQRQTYILEEQIRNLNTDIKYELGHTNEITELTRMGGKLRSDAQRLSDMVAGDGTYDEIIKSYKHFTTLWRDFVHELHPFENRYIERDIMSVYQTDSTLIELLWIPQEADWSQLEELSHILNRDVKDLFASVTMAQLVKLSNPQETLRAGQTYSELCSTFKRSVTDQRAPDELAEEFQLLDNSWKRFATKMIELKGTKTWSTMKLINNNIVSLRTALHIRPASYDNDSLAESAANLETMSEHMQFDMQRWLNSGQANVPYRSEYLRNTNEFVQLSRDFHRKLADGYRKDNSLKTSSTELLTRWLKILESIEQCRTREREHLNSTAQEITAELVKIQSQLTL